MGGWQPAGDGLSGLWRRWREQRLQAPTAVA